MFVASDKIKRRSGFCCFEEVVSTERAHHQDVMLP